VRATDTLSFTVLNLRAVVSALGEIVHPVWWGTAFMSETGFRFLERLYPRSFFNAALHAVGYAACDIHDRSVGRIGAYHLFRLTEGLEEEIRETSGAASQSFIDSFRFDLGNADRMMERLRILCDGRTSESVLPGARRIGYERDLRKRDVFAEAAVVYFHAFETGKAAFPYFTVEQNGTGTPHRL
jgi:hypothetical protein